MTNKKQIAANIEIFASDVDRYIEDKKRRIVLESVIKDKETYIRKLVEKNNRIQYPKKKLYENEVVTIESLSKAELILQKKKLENCGYLTAEKILRRLVENESYKRQASLLKDIVDIRQCKGDAIQRIENLGLLNNPNMKSELVLKIEQLKSLSPTKNTAIHDFKNLLTYYPNVHIQNEFENVQKNIQLNEKKVNSLLSEIDLLTSNNKILKLLSELSVHKNILIEYRNSAITGKGMVRCPICGTENFATMDEALILKEADEYVQQNCELVKVKEGERANLQTETELLYQKLINLLKSFIDEKRLEFETLQNELTPYFEMIEKFENIRKDLNIVKLDLEKIKCLLASVQCNILTQTEEKEKEKLYRKILSVLGYSYEGEDLHQTYEKVKGLIKERYGVNDFEYGLFVNKINAIEGMITDSELAEKNKELSRILQQNQTINNEIKELNKLKENAVSKANNIKHLVEKLSREEYEGIGPTLTKFYNKLISSNDNTGINIVQEKGGISIVDGKEKNIVNVLSNGQVSVFMLAYFFAGIHVRNSKEKIKIFFIDDLTACMDDVNMLAFVDMLKYQMTSKQNMEQLFFVTCDDRIGKLLKYKFEGRGIGIRNLSEDDIL